MTIGTNMAGRGTDIKLGGNLEAEIAKLESPSAADRAGKATRAGRVSFCRWKTI